jgi:hypothetical protein
MDLITKLQNLKESTQSIEVKDLCDVYISELKNGNSSINESQVVETIENKIEHSISPIEALRNEELERSKSRARMISESWSGMNSLSPSKNAGSYIDGKSEEKDSSEIETKINESLTEMAKFDKAAGSFIEYNKVEKLGIFESILKLTKKGIYEHNNFKILCENYVNALKNKSVPEYWIAESFVRDFTDYAWDTNVKEIVNSITESINRFRPEIEASKALYQIENSGNSEFYSPVKESISKWLVSESKSIPALSKDLGVWSFNPIIRNLINSLSILESNSSKINIPSVNGNSEIKKIYSPVLVEGGKTIFAIGKTLFEGSSDGVRKLSNQDVSKMDSEFLRLLESFYSEGVKVDANGIFIYKGDTKISILEKNEESRIYINDDLAKFENYNQLASMIGLKVSRSLGANDGKIVNTVINLYENFERIVELDFAKSIVSKVYEGASVNLIKWENKMYLQKVNETMRENSLYSVNGSQASNIVKEFLRYDISEGLTEFLDGEKKIKSIMFNDRKRVIENIAIIEGQMKKIETLASSNPLYKGSKQLAEAYSLLEKELQSLKSKWSTINAEIDSIENNPTEINNNLMEDSKFTVGDYVKVKENGNTGKVISVDTTSGSYTVLLDSGKTGDYGVEDIIDLEDAFKQSSEENAEEGEEEVKESNQPFAKAPSTGKIPHGKTPAQVLKSSTSAAPSTKDQEKDGKKDVENLKDSNLEEAPEDKNPEIKYKAEAGIGYNLEESQESLVKAPGGKSGADMSTEWEKSGLDSMNLSSAPGKEIGDSGYEVEYPEHKGSKPEISGNSNLASAPGMGKSKVEESDLSKLSQELADSPGSKVGDSGYKIKYPHHSSVNPDIENPKSMNLAEAPVRGSKVPSKDTTDPNFANSPGKEEGDSGYNVEYPEHKSGKGEIENLDHMNLAETPSKGADGEISYEANPEMGYNLTEGFERPSPELKKN